MNEKALKELSVKDRDYMVELLAKEAQALSPAERAHLVSRRDYLTDEVCARLGIDGAESQEVDSSDAIAYESMKVDDLKKMCDDRGIVLDPSIKKKADIIDILKSDDAGELLSEDESEEEEEVK